MNYSEQDLEVACNLFNQKAYEKALGMFEKLAKEGCETAILHMGWMFQEGLGVRQEMDQARSCYEKAAHSGSPIAYFYLGVVHEKMGKLEEALRAYTKSSDQDYLPATYRVGKMYAEGAGTQINYQKAQEYLRRAADKGHVFAQRSLAGIMIKNKLGAKNIVPGVAFLIKGFYNLWRISWVDPQSEKLK